MPANRTQDYVANRAENEGAYLHRYRWIFMAIIAVVVVTFVIATVLLKCKFRRARSGAQATAASDGYLLPVLVHASPANTSAAAAADNGSQLPFKSTPPPGYSARPTLSRTRCRLSIPLRVHALRTQAFDALYVEDSEYIIFGTVQYGVSRRAPSTSRHRDSVDLLPRYEEPPSYTTVGAINLH
ncbi:hypothetical protein T440DRAFT_479912 [Plenodomus tracheiphilus IPT5]|uniref:Uncharacterized protein n=1 Tax=Plenodomus tracheiphilus IPT5 TaxID=1408161 RepID=A0A6A7B2Y5_9PLEO|nr:hypothetical protein T440DRAFT_479912 [Plenodomus tracheiphilus IPT5]